VESSQSRNDGNESPSTGAFDDEPGNRLPELGGRGEGWVAIQVVLILAILACGLRGPRWPQALRPALRLAAAVNGLAGGALFVAGGAGLGRQLTPFPKPLQNGQLRDRGAYGVVRHPIYGGVLMLGLSWALLTSPAVLAPIVAGVPFFELKSRREEAWLEEQHPGYAAYRERVPKKFLPLVW